MGTTALITLSLLCAALVSSADDCQFAARSNDVFDAALFKDDTLNLHNQYRSEVGQGLQPLVWNGTLAALAQEWADNCQWAHRGPGENLHSSWGYSFVSVIGKFAVCTWHLEKNDFTYSSNTCSNTCGHYTQIVWRETTQLGCGYASCDFGDFVVCNYSPAGNYVGEKPY